MGSVYLAYTYASLNHRQVIITLEQEVFLFLLKMIRVKVNAFYFPFMLDGMLQGVNAWLPEILSYFSLQRILRGGKGRI